MQFNAKTKNEKRLAGWFSALSTALTMVLTAAALSAVTTAPVMGQTTGCTLATVKGNYGVLASGTALGIGPVTAVGVATLDGAGNVTYTATENYNGEIIPGILTGTYTLSSSCTGTVTIPEAPSGSLTFAAVVVDGGQQIYIMGATTSVPPPIFQTAVAKKIN